MFSVSGAIVQTRRSRQTATTVVSQYNAGLSPNYRARLCLLQVLTFTIFSACNGKRAMLLYSNCQIIFFEVCEQTEIERVLKI